MGGRTGECLLKTETEQRTRTRMMPFSPQTLQAQEPGELHAMYIINPDEDLVDQTRDLHCMGILTVVGVGHDVVVISASLRGWLINPNSSTRYNFMDKI